jgi:hypothetical protein
MLLISDILKETVNYQMAMVPLAPGGTKRILPAKLNTVFFPVLLGMTLIDDIPVAILNLPAFSDPSLFSMELNRMRRACEVKGATVARL